MREETEQRQQALSLFEGFQRIDDVVITIRAELDRRTISFRELLALEEDSILSFPRPAGENVDVYAEEVLIGTGEIIVVDSFLGVRMADLREVRTGSSTHLEAAVATT